ncbi:SAF domain-containing protein [uncultured Jatrophihabitans sp.]|uniref:SAF domain-containing protein n=1 Tax=uncultured Jatrophihabitans sp. TaxID=1610747 RepID=UPI0035CC3B14
MTVTPSHSVRPSQSPAQGAVPPSPQPRRIATPRWLDLRLVLGVLLVLASVLVGAKVVSGASATYPVVAVRHDLAAGTVLTGDDVALRQVQLPDHGNGVYLTRTTQAVGKRLTRAVSRDELLPAAAVGVAGAQVTLTVPLASGAAPSLRAGQRIEIWLSTAACASVVLLADVAVQSVRADNGTSFSNGSGGQDVVVDVAPAAASRVVQALAIDAAQLRAGVLTGGAAPSGAPSPSAPAAPSAPDVSSCGSASATH